MMGAQPTEIDGKKYSPVDNFDPSGIDNFTSSDIDYYFIDNKSNVTKIGKLFKFVCILYVQVRRNRIHRTS